MSKRNWGLIAASILGLTVYTFQFGVGIGALTAEPSHETQRSEDREAESQIQRGSPQPIVEEASGASDYEQPCNEGDENRASDLCAQWKAADAADSAADASWFFGFVGSSIGLATLLAAGLAAYYAKKAAEHTESGAVAAQQTLHADRAWLTFHEPWIARCINVLVDGFHIADGVAIRMDWENTGRSPAIRIGTHVDYRVVPLNGPLPVFERNFHPKERGAAVGTGKPLRTQFVYLGDAETALFRAHTHAIFMYSKLEYADIYQPDASHVSEACLIITYNAGDPNADLTSDHLTIAAIGPQNRCT